MADIFEIITAAGIEIPEDKKAALDTEIRKTYKHHSEVDALREQLKAAQEGLVAANGEIESFKELDLEGIKAAAEEWKTKASETERQANERIAEMQYEAALKDALASEKFSSEYARTGVLNEIKSKKLPLENGTIMGLKDALTAIKEAQPAAFIPESTKPPASAVFGGTGNTPLNTATKEDFKKLSYADRLKLKEENPTLYNNLKG